MLQSQDRTNKAQVHKPKPPTPVLDRRAETQQGREGGRRETKQARGPAKRRRPGRGGRGKTPTWTTSPTSPRQETAGRPRGAKDQARAPKEGRHRAGSTQLHDARPTGRSTEYTHAPPGEGPREFRGKAHARPSPDPPRAPTFSRKGQNSELCRRRHKGKAREAEKHPPRGTRRAREKPTEEPKNTNPRTRKTRGPHPKPKQDAKMYYGGAHSKSCATASKPQRTRTGPKRRPE